ncbi:MAG TPA: hypothetical protein VE968_04250 [Sphingomicrobium sp.]|nr:hypothetical protein [Sphingomicrobium sp.]
MAKPWTVTGWKLARGERDFLLQRFPPKYENVIADHVTLKTGTNGETPLPPRPKSARIVGRADDGRSLECLVVELDGTSDRPDGSIYHITWSLGPTRKARESNDLLRTRDWKTLATPVDLTLEPARF